MKKIMTINVFAIFILAFFLQIIQMSKVYLYFDDFGYASLSYVGLTDNQGTSYGLLQILKFLKNHYYLWGGRVLYFFWLIVLTKNIWLLRIVQSIIIVSLFFLIYKISLLKHEKLFFLSAFLPIILYAMLPLDIVSDAVYWYTASVLYLFPLPFLILGLKMFYDLSLRKDIVSKRYIVLMCFVLFCASFSQEQISTACLGGIILIIFLTCNKIRRINRGQLCGLTVTIVGFLLLALAPGNAMRIQRLNIHLSISQNFIDLAKLIGSGFTLKFMVLLFCCVILVNWMLIYKHIINNNIYTRFYFIIHEIITILIFIVLLVKRIGLYWLMLDLTNSDLMAVIILWLYLISIVVNFIIYYCIVNNELLLIYWISGVLTLALLAVSGSVSNRTLFPFLILSFIIMTDIICSFIQSTKVKLFKGILYIGIIFLLIYASYNWSEIYRGYALNAPIHESNNLILSQKRGSKNVESIVLQKEIDDRYGHIMPYFEGWEILDDYYKAYYDLPSNCILIWE